jgi:putative tricarboxylic transport membrane protein
MPTRPFARADLITGVVLVAFGLAALAESYGMPRLQERSINPWTIPGLVPGLLGIIIAILGAVLALRSVFAGALRPRHVVLTEEEALEARAARSRLILCSVLCFLYAAVLVGRTPFWFATFVFVFAFVAAFEWQKADPTPARLRKIGMAAVIAVFAAFVIPYTFETLFLVRLP